MWWSSAILLFILVGQPMDKKYLLRNAYLLLWKSWQKTLPQLVVPSCAQKMETAQDGQEGNFFFPQALCLAVLLNVARLYSYLADPAWQQCLDCLKQMRYLVTGPDKKLMQHGGQHFHDVKPPFLLRHKSAASSMLFLLEGFWKNNFWSGLKKYLKINQHQQSL